MGIRPASLVVLPQRYFGSTMSGLALERSVGAAAGCKESDSNVQGKCVGAKQCLNVLRQLEQTRILTTLHALQELDWSGQSLAALHACGCVISRPRSDFTTFMLWLRSANVAALVRQSTP